MGTTTALRASDLLSLPDPPDGAHYELNQGELITVGGAGYRHEYVKARIIEALVGWNLQVRSGLVMGESRFPLSEDTARQPDVAFVTQARMAGLPVDDNLIPFIPDLAIEVISQSESAADAELKVQQYLAAGVVEVWQVYPEARVVHVRTPGAIREVRPDQPVETPVLPGFRISASQFFE